MNRKRTLFLATAVFGVFMGFAARDARALEEAAGDQQCHYRVGIDPETACTGCFDPCSNGVCCKIVRTTSLE